MFTHYLNICSRTQCLNVKISSSTSNDCFYSTGVQYNGTVKKARNGKNCVYWNETVGYGNNYPTLQENYCRNPQGYQKQPWCYTNSMTRDWSFCDVHRCAEGSNTEGNSHEYIIYALLGLSIVCCSLFIGVRYFRTYVVKKRTIELEMVSYASYPLQSSEQIEKLLRQEK